MRHHIKRFYHAVNKTPLWKKLVAVFLIIAMPLFFYSYRATQLQNMNPQNITPNEENTSAFYPQNKDSSNQEGNPPERNPATS